MIGTGAEDRATQGCDLSADFRGRTMARGRTVVPGFISENKAYMGWQDRGKSQGVGGQRPPSSSKPSSDWLVLSLRCRGSVRGSYGDCGDLGAPTARTALEHMPVMEQTIEHGRDRRHVAQQFAPIFDPTVGSEQRAGALVA